MSKKRVKIILGKPKGMKHIFKRKLNPTIKIKNLKGGKRNVA